MKLVFWIRSFIAMLLFVVITLACSVIVILTNLIFNSKKVDDFVILTWAHIVCFIYRTKIKVSGKENIPHGHGSLFLFNHSSFFDIYALCYAAPFVRYGAKIELFSIPIFGFALRRLGTMPIARQKKEEVFKVYAEAKERFAKGESFALSPEGGRHHGEELARFKSGPFIFASSADADLVPVIIKGAYETMPKGHFIPNTDRWTREITVEFLPAIKTVDYNRDNLKELMDHTYEVMNQKYTH